MTATNAAGVLTVWAAPADTSSWNTMRDIHMRMADQLVADLAAGCGITITMYDILNRIDGGPLAPRVHDLLDTIPVAFQTLIGHVDDLVTRGLVARRQDAEGDRALRLTLTGTGRDLLARAAPVHAQAIAKHLPAHLTLKRFAQLSTALHL